MWTRLKNKIAQSCTELHGCCEKYTAHTPTLCVIPLNLRVCILQNKDSKKRKRFGITERTNKPV